MGPGDPTQLKGGWVFNFYPQYSLRTGAGAGAGAWKRGWGEGCLNPPPIRHVVMSKDKALLTLLYII